MSFTVSDVRPADVLLFRGNSWLSWAIRTFDGSDVSHAAIALGDGMLAEAAGDGLRTRDIPVPERGEYILVHRLTGEQTELGPVLEKARAYVDNGNEYAYQQLVLLAFLALTRRVPLRGLARRLMRTALDHAATAVMTLLPTGATWMICSEFVYRCYDEAAPAPPDPYALAIVGASFGPPSGDSGEPSLLDWAQANTRDLTMPAPTGPGITFGPGSGDAPGPLLGMLEADLAPLISEYASQLVSEGIADPADLPPLLDPSFGPGPATPEPDDDEMLASVARFATAVGAGSPGPGDGAPVTFSATVLAAVGATIGKAALEGALEGLRTMTVDPNFVTPRDLLMTPSLHEVGRIG